jgi:hypothetical protein
MARRPGHDGISTEAVAEPNELMMKGHIIVPLYFDNQFSEKPVYQPSAEDIGRSEQLDECIALFSPIDTPVPS